MKTVIIPTFDEFKRYEFVKNVEVKIKNKPTYKDVNKITSHLPGFCQGGIGREPLKDLLTNGKKEVRSFYDARQNTRKLKGFFVTMKSLTLILTIICASFCAHSQTVKQDSQGNYIAVKATRDSAGTSAKLTGKTFTTSKNETFPVWISKNGKLFVIRTSKSGNRYNQYLKL